MCDQYRPVQLYPSGINSYYILKCESQCVLWKQNTGPIKCTQREPTQYLHHRELLKPIARVLSKMVNCLQLVVYGVCYLISCVQLQHTTLHILWRLLLISENSAIDLVVWADSMLDWNMVGKAETPLYCLWNCNPQDYM